MSESKMNELDVRVMLTALKRTRQAVSLANEQLQLVYGVLPKVTGYTSEELQALMALPPQQASPGVDPSRPITLSGELGTVVSPAERKEIMDQVTALIPKPRSQEATAQKLRESVLAALFGPSSIWSLLAPEVYMFGNGLIAPGNGYQMYEQDAAAANTAQLALWREGFYREGQTGDLQFMIFDPNRMITLIKQAPRTDGRVVAHVRVGGQIERRHIEPDGNGLSAVLMPPESLELLLEHARTFRLRMQNVNLEKLV